MATTRTKKHRVLFVDDDSTFLEILGELFLLRNNGAWQVLSASTAAKALALLQEQQFDLVVLDINLPVVDGLQLLRLVHQRYPQLKKVVLTGYADEARRTECLSHGAELFIEKPRSSEGFETVFATLNELVAWKPQEGFRGVLRQVGLQDVLQLECLGRNSSVLEIFNAQVRGRIYIEEGAIIHAAAGAIKGEAAFHQLLSLPGGEFNLKPYEPAPERTLEGHWESLLMEAARVRDEKQEQSGVADADASAVGQAPALEEPVIPATPGTRIEEVVICSGQGAVLYEWQCEDMNARLKLFQHITQQAERLNQLHPFGRFDRLEFEGPQGRVVAQVQNDRRVLVCATQRDGREENA